MKKTLVVLVTLVMIFCLSACGKSSENVEDKSTKTTQEQSAGDNAEKTNEENSAKADENTQNNKKVLVAYFSATHTTEGVAKKIADGLGADLYQIKPENPYTDDDLNYNNKNSRATTEMNNPDARPAIAGSVENMDQYDTVFIGYPIWWSDAPRIISTFMESYDFSGKTIIPFCTSGSSGISSSETNLKKLTNNANWLEGKRLSGSDSQDTIMDWVNSLGL